jgi:hypothetical protein
MHHLEQYHVLPLYLITYLWISTKGLYLENFVWGIPQGMRLEFRDLPYVSMVVVMETHDIPFQYQPGATIEVMP